MSHQSMLGSGPLRLKAMGVQRARSGIVGMTAVQFYSGTRNTAIANVPGDFPFTSMTALPVLGQCDINMGGQGYSLALGTFRMVCRTSCRRPILRFHAPDPIASKVSTKLSQSNSI
jgi:hypothetical protein